MAASGSPPLPSLTDVAYDLIRRGGVEPTAADRILLTQALEGRVGVRIDEVEPTAADPVLLTGKAPATTPDEALRVEVLVKAAFRGFFRAGAAGVELAPAELIRLTFGGTLEENYVEAGPAFLRFARTYWTLKIRLRHPGFDPEAEATHKVLENVEFTVASVFFPTPGGARIDPAKREQMQRSLLRANCPEIDLEDFISRNPILIRDRAQGAPGCGTAAAAVLLALAATGAVGHLLLLPA